MSIRKKGLAFLLSAVMLVSTGLVGCGQKPQQDSNQTVGEKQQEQQQPKEEVKKAYEGKKIVHYYSQAEPQTLNAQKIWGAPEIVIVNMFQEGLLRPGKEEGQVIPGVAEKYDYDKDKNAYIFTLRSDAKWADGTPVTIADFFYGWRYVLDERTAYSFFMTDYIKGAKQYADYTKEAYLTEKDESFAKKDKDAKSEAIANMTEEQKAEFKAKKDELWKDVKAYDEDGKLVVEMTGPVPYFPSLAAFPTFAPLNQKFFEEAGEKYAVDADKLLSNGPWKVEEWKHKDSFKLVKNENYWNKDNINIDEINLKIVKDVNTRTNLLKTGKLDGSAIQSNDLPEFQDMAKVEEMGLQPLYDFAEYTVFYLEFNHFNNKITQNANIRRAMMYAMDRKGLVEKINIGDSEALGIIPKHFPGLEKTFREENGEEMFKDKDVEKAKEYLAKGLEELGMDKLPAIDVLIGESDIHKKNGVKFQNDLKEIGIEVNLLPLPWNAKLDRLQAGDFAVVGAGWGPDYPDPMTFLDLFQTENGSNNGKYSNPKYDELIAKAKKELDPKIRMQYLYEAEKMLIEDAVIVPQYFRVAHMIYKKYLTGVVNRGVAAEADFYWADIDMEAKMAEK